MCCATGWTWEYVGREMTLPRLQAFYRYWKIAPPVIESAAAIAIGIGVLKHEAPAPKPGTKEHDAAVGEFIGALPFRARPRPA